MINFERQQQRYFCRRSNGILMRWSFFLLLLRISFSIWCRIGSAATLSINVDVNIRFFEMGPGANVIASIGYLPIIFIDDFFCAEIEPNKKKENGNINIWSKRQNSINNGVRTESCSAHFESFGIWFRNVNGCCNVCVLLLDFHGQVLEPIDRSWKHLQLRDRFHDIWCFDDWTTLYWSNKKKMIIRLYFIKLRITQNFQWMRHFH